MSGEKVRKGDVVRCGRCGLSYVYRASGGAGCRRCGSPDLQRWRPQDDAATETPASAGPVPDR